MYLYWVASQRAAVQSLDQLTALLEQMTDTAIGVSEEFDPTDYGTSS